MQGLHFQVAVAETWPVDLAMDNRTGLPPSRGKRVAVSSVLVNAIGLTGRLSKGSFDL